jgi:pyrroline-5-carboxylate reductase
MTLRLAGPLLLVGAGKMGGALLEGWLRHGVDPAQIVVSDPAPPAEIAALIERHGIANDIAMARGPAAIVIAVKPQSIDEILPMVAPLAGKGTLILSIAAGRPLASLAPHFASGTAIVRAMPNTPASIGMGMTVACANEAVKQDQARECTNLLEAVGAVIWVEDESLMDAATAVSGSGPAYVFLLAECLAEAGVAEGLPKDIAADLARATIAGAGELLRRSDLLAAELRERVTSPKGTTAAALEILMGKGGFPELLRRAVAAAAERSRKLSS